jgi:hypothetical protein
MSLKKEHQGTIIAIWHAVDICLGLYYQKTPK